MLFLALGVAWGIPYLLIEVAVGDLEPATVWTIVGFVLVLAGSFLVTRKRADAVPASADEAPAPPRRPRRTSIRVTGECAQPFRTGSMMAS